MNEKIALPSLVALLAVQTGKSKKQCEDFLRVFFNTIVETLSEGENIKIKGVGTFKVVTVESRKSVNVNTGEQIEIPSHNKIVFVPAKELAEEVNAPFAMFDSIEIPDDAGQTELSGEDDNEIDTSEPDIRSESAESIKGTDSHNAEETEETEESAESQITETVVNTKEATELTTENVEEPKETTSEDAEDPAESTTEDVEEPSEVTDENNESTYEPETIEESGKSHRFLFGFISGIACCALACLVGYLFFAEDLVKLINSKDKTETVAVMPAQKPTTTIAPADTLAKDTTQNVVKKENSADMETDGNEVAPTQPSDTPVYDVISKTRYLTTMAKEHYGNYNLWSYIYEENKAILGHPDRIRPGTRVVIPKLSKYGINPNDPEDIRKAKAKGVQIYSRYQ